MCVCECVCVCARARVCARVCVCVRARVRVCVLMHAPHGMSRCPYGSCFSIAICFFGYESGMSHSTYMYIYIYIYIYVYTYIYMYKYIYIPWNGHIPVFASLMIIVRTYRKGQQQQAPAMYLTEALRG